MKLDEYPGLLDQPNRMLKDLGIDAQCVVSDDGNPFILTVNLVTGGDGRVFPMRFDRQRHLSGWDTERDRNRYFYELFKQEFNKIKVDKEESNQ